MASQVGKLSRARSVGDGDKKKLIIGVARGDTSPGRNGRNDPRLSAKKDKPSDGGPASTSSKGTSDISLDKNDGSNQSITKKSLLKQFLNRCRTSHEAGTIIDQVLHTYRYYETLPNLLSATIASFKECSAADSVAQTSIFLVLRKIINHETYVIFADEECMKILTGFAKSLSSSGSDLQKSFGHFLSRAIGQSKAPDSPVTRTRSQTVFAADQFPPLDKLAVQIATIDYNFLKRVKLADLYSASWMKQSADKNGMTAWIQNSNLFTRWVATKILRNPSKQARAKVIGKFIKLLDLLRDLGCMSGMMNLFMALHQHPVSRLKKSWRSVPKAIRHELERHERILKPTSNFSGYREMTGSLSRGTPYMAIIAKDLVACEEIPTFDEEDKINWHKMSRISGIISTVMSLQKTVAEFAPEPGTGFPELDDLEHADLIAADSLIEISEQLEPSEERSSSIPPPSPTTNQPPVPAHSPPPSSSSCNPPVSPSPRRLSISGSSPNHSPRPSMVDDAALLAMSEGGRCLTTVTHTLIASLRQLYQNRAPPKMSVDPIGLCIDALHTLSAVIASANLLATPALPVSLKAVVEALLNIYPDAQQRSSLKIEVNIPTEMAVRIVSHQLAAMLLSFLVIGTSDLETVALVAVNARQADKTAQIEVLLSQEEQSEAPTEPANSHSVYFAIKTLSTTIASAAALPVLRASSNTLLLTLSLPLADAVLPLTPLKINPIARSDSYVATGPVTPVRSPSLPYVFTPRGQGAVRKRDSVTVELPLVGPNGATATITLNSRDADGSLYSTLFERARTLLNLSSTDNIVYQFTDSEGDSFDVTEHESFDRLLDYIMDDLEHSPGGKLTLSIKTDERKRRVSEASLRYTVIEAPVVMTDNDGTLVFVNKTFLTLVGGSAEQYMRNRVESILVESLAEYRHISSSAESTVSTALITSHGPVPVAVKLSHEGEFWVWTLTVLSSPAPAILKEATTSDDVSDAADFVIRSASSSLSDLPIVGLGAGPL